MRLKKLTEAEISDRMGGLPGWELAGETIAKTFGFASFVQSMEFVNQLAKSAEEMQHHPDIDIRYNKVTISLSTHDTSGLTANDFDLANVADELGGAAAVSKSA